MDLGLKGAAICVSGGTKGLGREAAPCGKGMEAWDPARRNREDACITNR